MGATGRQVVAGGALISAGTLATRVLGMVREIIAAALFGTSAVFDAFVVAFSVPNLLRRVLGEEMFERALLPPYRRLCAEGRGADARRFLARVFSLVCAAAVVAVGVLFVTAPVLVRLLAPGMDAATTELTIRLARLLTPFLALIALATFAGALLLFSGRRLLYGLAPAAMNLAVVGVLLWTHHQYGVLALVLAWLAGALVYLVVQLPSVFRIIRAMPEGGQPDAVPLSTTLREGARILASAFILKTVELVDRVVASFLGAGAISALYFSFRLVHLPFSILSLALTRSLAPELSRVRGEADPVGLGRLVRLGVEANLFVLAPVTVFLALFADDVVMILYGRGSFAASSVEATALAFRYYALAILPMGLVTLLNRVYSALEDNRMPLIAAGIGGGVNIVGDLLLFSTPLAQGGIALASAIAWTVQTLVMVTWLRRFLVPFELRQLVGTGVRLLLAVSGFVAVIGALWPLLPVADGTLLTGCWRLVVAGFPAFAVFAVLAFLLWDRGRPERMRVVLAGGGTGGHVYPALAIHRLLDRHGMVDEALYVGVVDRAEEKIVPRSGLHLQCVDSAPFAGGTLPERLGALTRIAHGTVQCIGHLVRFRPHLVVATGGYAAAPTIFAAFLLRPWLHLRIVVDEQNLVPGALNKVASLLADVVLVSFAETGYFLWSNRCTYTGYPVRATYLQPAPEDSELRARLGVASDDEIVLVFGGSMGARSVNRALVEALPALMGCGRQLVVLHAIGMMASDAYDAVADTSERLLDRFGGQFDRESLVLRDRSGRVVYRGFRYLDELVDAQRVASLVVCRGGAGALAEVMVLGSAAVVVPKRGLPGDHQELNAIGMAERGGVEVVFERVDNTTGEDVVDADELAGMVIHLLSDPNRRRELGAAAHAMAPLDADDRIVAAIQAVVSGEEPELQSEVMEPQFVRFQRLFDSLVKHLDGASCESLYHRLYEIKLEEYIRSDNFLTFNKGVKLIGALRRADYYPMLVERYPSFRGYVRRNVLMALTKADRYDPVFVRAVQLGLADRYWEARREAVALLSRFWVDIAEAVSDDQQDRLRRRVLGFLDSRWESFEVRARAVRAAVRILPEEEFLRRMGRLRNAGGVRLREALLQAVQEGLEGGWLQDRKRVRRFVKGVLITTSGYTPTFRVRSLYVNVLKTLENGR